MLRNLCRGERSPFGRSPTDPPAETRETEATPTSAPLSQRREVAATAAAADGYPHAITEAHRRRLLGGHLLAASPRLDWAKLLRRTYLVDVLQCPTCGGPTRIIAAITDPPVIRAILGHLREPAARAPPSGARDPEFDDQGDEAWLEVEVVERVDGIDHHDVV